MRGSPHCNRRNFVKSALAAPLICAASNGRADAPSRPGGALADGSSHPMAGKPLPPWKPGEFQVHFIYTGVAESMFWIYIHITLGCCVTETQGR